MNILKKIAKIYNNFNDKIFEAMPIIVTGLLGVLYFKNLKDNAYIDENKTIANYYSNLLLRESLRISGSRIEKVNNLSLKHKKIGTIIKYVTPYIAGLFFQGIYNHQEFSVEATYIETNQTSGKTTQVYDSNIQTEIIPGNWIDMNKTYPTNGGFEDLIEEIKIAHMDDFKDYQNQQRQIVNNGQDLGKEPDTIETIFMKDDEKIISLESSYDSEKSSWVIQVEVSESASYKIKPTDMAVLPGVAHVLRDAKDFRNSRKK